MAACTGGVGRNHGGVTAAHNVRAATLGLLQLPEHTPSALNGECTHASQARRVAPPGFKIHCGIACCIPGILSAKQILRCKISGRTVPSWLASSSANWQLCVAVLTLSALRLSLWKSRPPHVRSILAPTMPALSMASKVSTVWLEGPKAHTSLVPGAAAASGQDVHASGNVQWRRACLKS